MSYDAKGNQLFLPFFNFGIIRMDLANNTFSVLLEPDGDMLHASYMHVDDGELFIGMAGDLRACRLVGNEVTLLGNTLLPDSMIVSRKGIVSCLKTRNGVYYIKRSDGSLVVTNGDRFSILHGNGFKPNISISPDEKYISYVNIDLDLVRISVSEDRADTIKLQELLQRANFSFSNPRHMVDDGESVWITGQNGVLRYNYLREALQAYGMEKGLSHTFTFSVVLDLNNQVYIGSIGGIDRYNPVTNRFESMYSVQDNSYMDAFGHALRVANGDLYFQFGNRLVRIRPGALSATTGLDKSLQLHEVSVNGNAVHWEETDLLNKLGYQQNQLMFVFDIPWFGDPDLVRFEYRLNDQAWVDNGTVNRVQLNGLAPGKYQLEIRLAGSQLQSTTESLIIPFRIRPPFWMSWWFIAGFAIIVFSVILYFFQLHINRIKERASVRVQLMQLKSTALRAQMNPHFVFNSLNAIQECVVTGKVDEAYIYLSKFSRLLRLVLEHSDKRAVLLQDEMEVLTLYLSMEQLRFNQELEFTLRVAPDLDAEDIYIPSMLIQPHLENAVWHGLRQKLGEKCIDVVVEEYAGAYVRITITDNGIGRQAATQFQSQQISSGHHRPMGFAISSEQLGLLQQRYPQAAISIEDLITAEGLASGTKVVLVLPMMEKPTFVISHGTQAHIDR
jgi:hypothetical protein